MKNLFFVLMLAAAPAFAEGPCAKDRETYCPGMKAGHGLIKCLKEHDDKLSAECKAHRAEVKEKLGDLKAACEADAEKLCPGEKGRARMKCLRGKKEEVSEGCKAEWKELKAAKKNRGKH